MDQNSQNIVLINNSRTAWPTLSWMLFLSSLDNLLSDAYITFQKGVDNFEIAYLPSYKNQKTGHPATLGLEYDVPNLETLRMVWVCILPSIMEGFKGLKIFHNFLETMLEHVCELKLHYFSCSYSWISHH